MDLLLVCTTISIRIGNSVISIYVNKRPMGNAITTRRAASLTVGRVGHELLAGESYEEQRKGQPAEASRSEPLAHDFVHTGPLVLKIF